MTQARVKRLVHLARESNTQFLLVSGGGEGFLELEAIEHLAQYSPARYTWLVTSGYWAGSPQRATNVIRRLEKAASKGDANRHVVLRISLDEEHLERLQAPGDRWGFVTNIIAGIRDADASSLALQFHLLEGNEHLLEELASHLEANLCSTHDTVHESSKQTEAAYTLHLPDGLSIEATFAKYLHADLAADLRDHELLEKRIAVFDRDYQTNQHGCPGVQFNGNHDAGLNLLIVYDGRVAPWQSEMPDVPISIDTDDYTTIRNKILSDPAVLATLEAGLSHRFSIVAEVDPKAVLRAKAVNVRDYTSPILMEDNRIKLYYTIRSIQHFMRSGRAEIDAIGTADSKLRSLLEAPTDSLKSLYHSSGNDVWQQLRAIDDRFSEFYSLLKEQASDTVLVGFLSERPPRVVDKWRLLVRRTRHGWYPDSRLPEAISAQLTHLEELAVEVLGTNMGIYEGLSQRRPETVELMDQI